MVQKYGFRCEGSSGVAIVFELREGCEPDVGTEKFLRTSNLVFDILLPLDLRSPLARKGGGFLRRYA